MQYLLLPSAFWRNIRIILSFCLLGFGLVASSAAFLAPPPQGGGTIVLEENLLRAISMYPEDPVIRIELWYDSGLVHTESSCGSQSCSTDISHLSAGTYLAKGFTQGSAQFAEEIVVE